MAKDWESDQNPIESEDDFLNDMDYENVSDFQRMHWHAVKIQVHSDTRDPDNNDGAYRFWFNTADDKLFIRRSGVPPNTVWWELKVK